MPVSPRNEPRNFINKVRGYQRVIGTPNSMTFMDDLVRCIDWVIKERKIGIYHVVNPEPLSAARVMHEYQKYNPDHKFDIISEADLDKITVAKRSNCILNTQKLNDAGFFMTPSEEALINCMEKYGK
jgi:3,5-epimerase/4-reductase